MTEVERIIGIDFGTTNSAVSIYDGRRPRVLLGDDGEALMPSAVYIDDERAVHVGYPARNVLLLYPERTVTSVKRVIGTDKEYLIGGQSYTPEELASFIFAGLKARCELRLNDAVEQAVVSVPAYFDETKRQAIKRAARMAGLEVIRLINEPTAASLACGPDREGNILVYDLGGGTFDVSVLEAGGGVYRVLSSRGDAHLGGDDFDNELIELLLASFAEETGLDLRDDRLAMHKLRVEAERAKIALSSEPEAGISIPFIAANLQGACHLEEVVTREAFEERIRGYLKRTLRLTRGALSDAGLRPEEIDHLILVGGSTRIPALRSAVESLIGRAAEPAVDPERAVAEGAAMQAGIIAGTTTGTVLVDVTPLGLGVEGGDDEFVTLVPRNSVLPAEARAVFTTVSDFQRKARVSVLQGEGRVASEAIRLGSFELEAIERAPRGGPEIEITFRLDVDGLLTVHACDLNTGSAQALQLEAAAQVDEETSSSMVERAREAELDRVIYGETGA